MRGEPESVRRSVGVNIAKKFGRSATLVPADAETNDVAIPVPHREFRHLARSLGSKMAHRVKNPQQRDSEVTLATQARTLQPLEDRGKVEPPPQAHADRNVHFCMKHVLRLEPLHHAV